MEEEVKQKPACNCPHCHSELIFRGEVAIPLVMAGLFGIKYVPKEGISYTSTHLPVKAYKCPDCGYVALWGEPEEQKDEPLPNTADIKICPHCRARNFRRTVCHKCGAELPDEEKDDRFDYSDKFK